MSLGNELRKTVKWFQSWRAVFGSTRSRVRQIAGERRQTAGDRLQFMRQTSTVRSKDLTHEPRRLAEANGASLGRGHNSAYDELAAIVEHSNDAIFSRTFAGIIKTWNAAAERIFGFTAGEIVGRSSRILLPRGYRDEFRRLIAQMRRGEPMEHFETERIRKDGRRIHVSLTFSPVRDASGRLVSFSTIARDITADYRMRDALARRERELEDLFEEASVGLAMVARDGKLLRASKAFGELVGFPTATESPEHGGECSSERPGRARGQGDHCLGSAVGPEPHVGRGARCAQHVVSCAQGLRSIHQSKCRGRLGYLSYSRSKSWTP